MNFKKKVNSSWADIPHYVHKTATDTITTLPADIYPNDATATVGLKGQTVQSSTPSPTSPVMPQGTGDKTANLFDEEYPDISRIIRYTPLYVGEGSFTLSTTAPYDSSVANVFLLSGNVSSGASTLKNGAWLNHNVTAQSDGGYITIAYRHYTNTTSPTECNTMLNSGSQPLPYEPYGIKIPISSANTTTPVYLGEVETTRKIKKLVLTGNEDWHKSSVFKGSCFAYLSNVAPDAKPFSTIVCTHAKNQSGTYYYGYGRIDENSLSLWLFDSEITVAAFKSYLADQYAAGTPVTVWYVLATETTGIVNEPIRKIGDYADEVSGITIPTIAGANTLSVDTTLQPSEVTVNYKGWHPVQSVHERESGTWT